MQFLTRICLRLVQNLLPDAFVLAVVLTVIVLAAGVGLGGKSFAAMIQYWGTGFSSLHTFAMQMALVLLTGYVLALTPALKALLNKITSLPKNPNQALGITAVTSLTACYFNWGFGMVIGAILAREMGKKVRGLHFPLLVAAAHGGEIMRGPSSSIPLVAATPGNFMTKLGFELVPASATLYAWWNIVLSLLIFVALFAVYYHFKPPTMIVEFQEEVKPVLPKAAVANKVFTFAERLDASWGVNCVLGLFPLSYLAINISKLGFNLDLNLVILIFLTIGVFLHPSPNSYLAAVKEAIVASRGIVMQFPLYAGISGMVVGSGLVNIMSAWFISISNIHTFPALTFLSAGLVNIFIPSGGGQWAIQGPIMMKAAATIGADVPQTIMAFAWGDAWTNQIQPFWALPLLGVAGLSARDIMGYCTIWAAVSGTIISIFFVALNYFT